MECAEADTLALLVEGALAEAERAAIATHAASCARCHALLEGLLDSSSGSIHPASPTETTQGDDDGGARAGEVARISLRPGARIGRYVIEERIGAGGMGVVFAATDSELQRKVAIKLLRSSGLGPIGTQGRERLLREARLLASLSHPNVVTVFDVGTHEGHVFIAMELVDGGTLSAWLRRSPRTQAEIIDRMIEAGRGLAAAHAGGVVHRDVKPDNILVGRDGLAQVTDFGLARIDQELAPELDATKAAALSPDLTKTGALMGTPVYMAPEQWEKGDVDPRTDQWAFCATLYELVAGVRPFTVDDPRARVTEIEEGRIASPAEGRTVPSWLRRIIARGLRADQAERWSSMDAVVDALVRGRQRRSRILRAVALAGVLVLAIGSLAFAASRHHTPAKPNPEERLAHLAWIDLRPGCSCPFSKCERGKCLSVCDASDFDYTKRVPVPGISVNGDQELLMGISADEQSILYLTGKGCSRDRLMLAKRVGATFVPTELTNKLDPTRVEILEGCCALAADASSMIVRDLDHQRFHRFTFASSTLDDGAEFVDLLPSKQPGTELRFPVLSNDQRVIYYTVFDRSSGNEEAGPLDGIYMATRASTSVPFPTGKRLNGFARTYEYASSESSDHLALFMAGEWLTHTLVRGSRDEPFGVVGVGTIPALVPGWRAIPSADCQRMYTTATPGGCQGEDIVWMPAVHRPPVASYERGE